MYIIQPSKNNGSAENQHNALMKIKMALGATNLWHWVQPTYVPTSKLQGNKPFTLTLSMQQYNFRRMPTIISLNDVSPKF